MLAVFVGVLAERGSLRPGRTALHYLRRPGKIVPFLGLAAGVRRGSQQLSAFMRECLYEWSLEP
jgi:hypothetical protein